MSRIGPKHILIILLTVTFLAAGIALGSYYIPAEALTARRSPLSFIPLNYRQMWVDYRLLVGVSGAGLFITMGGSWLSAEIVARIWQRTRNRELAANAVLLRLAPRIDEKSKWQAAADMWAAIHSTLASPNRHVWLGAGFHMSLEIVQQAGERVTFYLWAPRPVAETLTRQLRAIYAGLEIETLVKSDSNGAPTNEIDDYLNLFAGNSRKSNTGTPKLRWADLGLARNSWRPLRTEFAADPLSSLLSASLALRRAANRSCTSPLLCILHNFM